MLDEKYRKMSLLELATEHAKLQQWLKKITTEEMGVRELLAARLRDELTMKDSGTSKYELSASMQVTVKTGYRYSIVESEAIAARDVILQELGESHLSRWHAVFPAKLDVSMKAFNAITKDDPIYPILLPAIESKPNKPSFEYVIGS